jgi:uncharacterized membrane protein YdjX (TVP38/TMEM64 family)
LTPAPDDDAADAVLPAQSPRNALLLAALVVACVVAAYFTPLRDAFSESGRESLRHRIEDLGPWAPPAFVLLAAVGVAIGIPRLALAALAGVLFDWLLGSALAQVGTFIGCWATFAVGRALGRDYLDAAVRRRLPRAAALLDFIGRHGFAANVMLRLSPVGNAFATNLLMAMSSVGTGVFLVGTFVGTLPETVIMALGGSAAGAAHPEGAASRLILAAAAMAVLVAGVALWTRRARRGAG